jgi:hypothetical protein
VVSVTKKYTTLLATDDTGQQSHHLIIGASRLLPQDCDFTVLLPETRGPVRPEQLLWQSGLKVEENGELATQRGGAIGFFIFTAVGLGFVAYAVYQLFASGFFH